MTKEITITEKEGKTFTMNETDFRDRILEYLSELHPQNRGNVLEARRNILEYYYTYQFLEREFGWLPSLIMEDIRPQIESVLQISL